MCPSTPVKMEESYLLGLLAMIKCSICSYQCDSWYGVYWPHFVTSMFRGEGRCPGSPGPPSSVAPPSHSRRARCTRRPLGQRLKYCLLAAIIDVLFRIVLVFCLCIGCRLVADWVTYELKIVTCHVVPNHFKCGCEKPIETPCICIELIASDYVSFLQRRLYSYRITSVVI